MGIELASELFPGEVVAAAPTLPPGGRSGFVLDVAVPAVRRPFGWAPSSTALSPQSTYGASCARPRQRLRPGRGTARLLLGCALLRGRIPAPANSACGCRCCGGFLPRLTTLLHVCLQTRLRPFQEHVRNLFPGPVRSVSRLSGAERPFPW